MKLFTQIAPFLFRKADAPQDVAQKAASAGYVVKAYHGTSSFKGHSFDPKMSAQGVFWFTEDEDSIASGKSGALGTSTVIPVYLNPGRTANRDEYEKRSIFELRQHGFDSVNLNGNWIIFDPTRIKSADPVTYDNNGRPIPLSARFNPSKKDIRY